MLTQEHYYDVVVDVRTHDIS